MSGLERTEPCAICGGEMGTELLSIESPDRFERHVGIAADGYVRKWVECRDCGVATNVYLEGVLERLGALSSGYYEVDLQGGSIGDRYRSVMTLPLAGSDNAQRVARIRRFLETGCGPDADPRRVLDVGAGTGVFLSRFLDEARAAGEYWSAVAVEPDPIAAAHLRGIGRFEVVESKYARGDACSDFDLCTLNKVVEHLADPVALLRDAATALRSPSGVMYVEVPDKTTLFYRPPTDNILGALHRHLYDIRSLDEALRRAGLSALAIERLLEPSGKITLAAFAVKRETLIHRFGGSTA